MINITKLDFSILDFIQQNIRCGFLDWLMPQITALGDFGFLWIVLGVVLTCIKKYEKSGTAILIGLLLCFIIGNIMLKPMIARDRPAWINAEIQMLIDIPHDYSFPSGHTMTAFASAFILMFTDKKLSIIALILACLIAFSRLYLYVHFPSDVFFGILIGFIVAAFVNVVYCKRLYPKIKNSFSK